MTPAQAPWWMFGFAALIAFGIYRRWRRNFGRQPLRPLRMGIRIALLCAISALLAPAASRSSAFLAASAAGLAIGCGLSLWAAARLRFEMHGGTVHYIPHTATGVAVFALFVARLGYRLVQIGVAGGLPGVPADSPTTGWSPLAQVQSPLTLGLFFLLAGYYVPYYGRVLWKSRHLSPGDLEPPVAPT